MDKKFFRGRHPRGKLVRVTFFWQQADLQGQSALLTLSGTRPYEHERRRSPYTQQMFSTAYHTFSSTDRRLNPFVSHSPTPDHAFTPVKHRLVIAFSLPGARLRTTIHHFTFDLQRSRTQPHCTKNPIRSTQRHASNVRETIHICFWRVHKRTTRKERETVKTGDSARGVFKCDHSVSSACVFEA
ncbi:hypothetical protein BaRGS_00001760 [Batillaria attramentaria]|uniref:Uncharacterized protein n=1 Tax=Batillaria attramentaria TaxID=370345 RepID=A0ABD0M4Z8_9CAEN